MSVYLWKVDSQAVYHTDLEAAKQLDGLSRKPDLTITESEFAEAGSLARIIDGKIVLGETEKEKADEAARQRIAEIDARFPEIDQALMRPVAAHIKGIQSDDDASKLDELTAEADALRAERKQLGISLSA
jgi:hypothetical protein